MTGKKEEKTVAPTEKVITLADVLMADAAWSQLLKQDLGPRLGYELSAYHRDNIAPELKTINEEKNKALEKYGKKGKGNLYRLEAESIQKYHEEFEVEYLSNPTKIKPFQKPILDVIDDVEQTPTNKVKPEHWTSLSVFFDEPVKH